MTYSITYKGCSFSPQRIYLNFDTFDFFLKLPIFLLDLEKITMFENYSKSLIWNFQFWHFPPIFRPNESDLSGNTVWPQVSAFQKPAKIDYFWHFQLIFVHSKCKRSSQCKMRLLWVIFKHCEDCDRNRVEIENCVTLSHRGKNNFVRRNSILKSSTSCCVALFFLACQVWSPRRLSSNALEENVLNF